VYGRLSATLTIHMKRARENAGKELNRRNRRSRCFGIRHAEAGKHEDMLPGPLPALLPVKQ